MLTEGFPILYDTQITAQDDVAAAYQPGMIFLYRCGTGRTNLSLVKYVQLDNNGCDAGNALVKNYATIKNYSVMKSAVTDGGGPISGIAAATIASQYFGFMYIGGYVPSVLQSNTTASGEYLTVSASTAGCLTNDIASCFNIGSTQTFYNASGMVIVGRAQGVVASAGYGSIMLCGIWG